MKHLVILSGGQDSTTCLALSLEQVGAENVHAVTFDYGQRHSVEIGAARTIAIKAGIFDRHEIIGIPGILKGTSPLVNKAVPVAQYANAEVLPGGLEKTFVPMRNMLFLTIAANRAVVLAKNAAGVALITGLSQEDFGGYPDCRERFVYAVDHTFRAALDDPGLPLIHLWTPLLNLTKKQTVELSEQTPLARELLALSHTCYNGAVPPCGKCHACLLRKKGYDEAGVVDPLIERLLPLHPLSL